MTAPFRFYGPTAPYSQRTFNAAMDTVADSAARGHAIPAGVAEQTGYSNGTVCCIWKAICDRLGEVVR